MLAGQALLRTWLPAGGLLPLKCLVHPPHRRLPLPPACTYIHTAAYGHFGRSDRPDVFTWEKVVPLKDA